MPAHPPDTDRKVPAEGASPAPAAARKVSSRLLDLDVFRGVAALAVVFYHYTVIYGKKYGYAEEPAYALTLGYYGVQLFFIISGFVIFLTLLRTKAPLDFVVSRFTRIFPLYWVAVILAFLVLTFAGLPIERPELSRFIANFFLFQIWFGFDYLDGVYWSLIVEILFYFWMFLVFLTRQLHRIVWFCWGWLAVTWIAHGIEMTTGAFPWYLKELFIVNYAHLFIAGILFYRAYADGWKRPEIFLLFVCLISELFVGGWQGLLLVASFFAAFALFVNGKLGWIAIKPMVFLGSISYAFYLVHQNLSYAVMHFLYGYGLPNLIVMAAALVVSIATAALLTRFFEQPVLGWMRKTYKSWKEKRASEGSGKLKQGGQTATAASPLGATLTETSEIAAPSHKD